MAININAPLKINAVDDNGLYLPKAEITYGPYESKASAIAAITSLYGSVSDVPLGVSFGVVINGTITEYQYKTGVFNANNCIEVGSGAGAGEIVEVVDTNGNRSNTNYKQIEKKVNALITCVTNLIDSVVFHTSTPFVIPSTLGSQLDLLRLVLSTGEVEDEEDDDDDDDDGGDEDDTSSTSLCGSAVCGQAICGN